MKEEIFYRLLVVDQDNDEIKYLKDTITSNFRAVIYTANTYKDAIMMIDYHAFDMIVINLDIPELDGNKLSMYATKTFLNSTSPVLFLSSSDNHETIPESNQISLLIEYLKKPVRQSELIRILNLYFRFIKAEKDIQYQLDEAIKLRKITEAELNKSRENFKNIVENSDAGILIVDQNGIIQFVNEAGEEIFLRRKEELIDNTFGLLSGYDKKTEIDIVRKNGEVGIGEITTSTTEWMGKPATLVLINDITKHKKLQESLLDAKLKAQESDRLKTAFLANMSHEIRTPLNGILGFSQLLDSNDIDEEQRHLYVKTIISCGNYLLGIINDIIDISQIESNQMIINKTNFDLIHMLNDLEELYKVNPKLTTKNLDLVVEKPPLKSLIILSDALRLEQILVNLINNAVKFTKEGQIHFGFEIKDNKHIEFYVTDTGIGIQKSEYKNIFERFRQIEPSKTLLNEGNGLGLSIAKALVNLLGGRIWLKSKPNVGTTFYFTIETQIIHSSNHVKNIQNARVKGEFRNKKILIVEDEETNFLFLQSVIKDYGTIIFWAKNGEEAVQIATNEDIDLILMDMKLPLKNGYDATKEIRHLKPLIPIIAQTAYAMGSDKDKVFEAGCNDYIAKPIKIDELMSKINGFLN